MSAQDNLGRQFDVYRGVQVPGTGINRSNLGVHWTSAPEVAEDFAKGERMGAYATHRSSYKGSSSVIHAVTTPESVHPMDKEEDFEDYGIAIDQDEAEIPLKHDAPVRIKSVTTYRGANKKARKRTYNPPREAKA